MKQFIELDEKREFKVTPRGVVKYSKLGYGQISDLITGNHNALLQLSEKLGEELFEELLQLLDGQNGAKTQEEKDKFDESLGRFCATHHVDFESMTQTIEAEQAVAIVQIFLVGDFSEDQVYEMIEKACDNPENPINATNFHREVYKLLIESQAPQLDEKLEKEVPLDQSQAKK